MSKLYINEFSNLAKDSTGATLPVPLAVETGGLNQVITIGATSLASARLNDNTTFVRVLSDVNCFVAYGTNPTATNSSFRLIASRPEIFGVQAGRGMKIAVING